MNPYFGEKWDAPATDDARQVPTPVGEECIGCGLPVEDGDRGFLMGRLGADGSTAEVPHHRECQIASTIGHLVGVCSCMRDGEPTPEQRRADALEAWRRFQLRYDC